MCITSQLWYYQGLEVDFSSYFEPFWADTLPGYLMAHTQVISLIILLENPLDILLTEVLEEFENKIIFSDRNLN